EPLRLEVAPGHRGRRDLLHPPRDRKAPRRRSRPLPRRSHPRRRPRRGPAALAPGRRGALIGAALPRRAPQLNTGDGETLLRGDQLAPPPHGLVAESELVGDLAQRGALGPPRPDPFPRAPPQLVGEALAAASLVPGQLSHQNPSLVVAPDRKSTRLNSSHVKTSHAVL